jgi:hypothetical protein
VATTATTVATTSNYLSQRHANKSTPIDENPAFPRVIVWPILFLWEGLEQIGISTISSVSTGLRPHGK